MNASQRKICRHSYSSFFRGIVAPVIVKCLFVSVKIKIYSFARSEAAESNSKSLSETRLLVYKTNLRIIFPNCATYSRRIAVITGSVHRPYLKPIYISRCNIIVLWECIGTFCNSVIVICGIVLPVFACRIQNIIAYNVRVDRCSPAKVYFSRN